MNVRHKLSHCFSCINIIKYRMLEIVKCLLKPGANEPSGGHNDDYGKKTAALKYVMKPLVRNHKALLNISFFIGESSVIVYCEEKEKQKGYTRTWNAADKLQSRIKHRSFVNPIFCDICASLDL